MYRQIFKNVLNPIFESAIKRRNMLKYRAFLEESQWWPYEKLRELQWNELSKLLRHAYERVPHWSRQFDGLGLKPSDIRTDDDLRRLPIIEKKDIRDNYDSMVAKNYKQKTWKKSTGGSTGEPLHFEYTPDSYDWRVAVSKRGYSWAGCEDGVKQALIWGAAIGQASPLRRMKENLHHMLLRQKYFNCFEFSKKEMEKALLALNRYKPEIIIGYTNPLYTFAKFVSRSGNLKFEPKAIISAAEKLHDFQRDEISAAFGCGVFDTYGSREFMLIASECDRQGGLHINVENLFVEVIKEDGTPAKAGETGEVIITDLHNYGMPFIRYKIGDMAVLADRTCPCGRGSPLLKNVVGRSLDMIKTPDGRNIPGEFFPHLMKEFTEIERFQVVQDDIGRLRVKMVRKPLTLTLSPEGRGNSSIAVMKREIRKVMGDKVNIDFEFLDEIPLTATGKHRVTICNLNSIAGD